MYCDKKTRMDYIYRANDICSRGHDFFALVSREYIEQDCFLGLNEN